jgi:hypothetical protein
MIVPFSYPYFQEKKKKLLNSNKSPKSTATKMGSFFSDFVDNDSAPLQQQGLLHGGPALSSLQAAGVSHVGGGALLHGAARACSIGGGQVLKLGVAPLLKIMEQRFTPKGA